MSGPEYMSENPTGVTGETGPTEPKVVVAPEAKPGPFSRWFGRGPKPQVLVAPGEQIPPVTAPEVPTDQPPEPASPSDQEETPVGGQGGSGDGNGSPEGPKGPESPERNWGFPENIWGPEFREKGISIISGILELEGQPYQRRYSADNIINVDGQQKYKLDHLYEEFRAWVAAKGGQSIEREPFDESKLPPEGLGQAEQPEQPQQELQSGQRQPTEEEIARNEMLKEVFWAPYYADYFTISAKTPEEFQRAVRTFTQWVRTGLGKSPDEIYRKVNGFIAELTAKGETRVLASAGEPGGEKITRGFMLDLKRELEALVGVYGADWANEHYNAKNLQDFLGYLAKDEGGKRFIRFSKLYNGKVAAVLWKLDKDPRFELLFSPHGSRGQLMRERDSIAQRELIDQIQAILISEIMGVRIKEYHPSDTGKRKRSKYRSDNLDDITRFQSDEGFKNLFEGFDQEAQGMPDSEALIKVKNIQRRLQAGTDPDDLTGEEKEIYEEDVTAFKLGYELYGAMGEKAKRSGGVFLVDREVAGREFVDYVPIHWAEKFVQFAENWTKATYGGKPAAEVEYRVAQARKRAIERLKQDGFDAKLFDVDYEFKYKYVTKDENNKDLITPQLELVKDKEGNPVVTPRGGWEPMLLKRPRILGYSQTGQPIIVLDEEYRPIGLGENDFDENRAIIYDKPRGDNRNRISLDTLDRTVLTKRDDGTFVYVEKVPVDFDTAIHHIYSRWTSHSYWGYQEEDTSLFLSDRSFREARSIKEGQLRPEDASPHAVQLLIVDPTLERVGLFLDHEGREDKITLAAVEDSYQGHWIIIEELYKKFYREDADDEYNRTAYVLQDQGGSTKQWFHIRAEAARWTEAKTRRLRTMIPVLPLHFASMSEMWGAPSGALDVIRMMAYKQYPMVGQFALEKWIGQTSAAQDVYAAIAGFLSEQEKRSREGVGEKPTNDADKLSQFIRQLKGSFYKNNEYDPKAGAEDEDNRFLNGVRDSLERLEVICQRVRVLETDMRGERAPLWLKGVDVWERRSDGSIKTQDGQRVFNREIDKNHFSGSSRHSLTRFVKDYIRWLRSEMEEVEGQALYPDVALFYEFMDKHTYASMRAVKEGRPGAKLQTHWEWLIGKIVR